MDTDRVEPRFQKYALLLKCVLLSGVGAFVLYKVLQIFTGDAPVDITMQTIHGLGMWAVCDMSNQGGLYSGVYGVGTRVASGAADNGLGNLANESAHVVISSRQAMDISDNLRLNCSVVDLTQFQPPAAPAFVSICVDSGVAWWFRMDTPGVWTSIERSCCSRHMLYDFRKHAEGWNLGYWSTTTSIITTSEVPDPHRQLPHPSTMCPLSDWVKFRDDGPSAVIAITLRVTESMMVTSRKQGVLPQLFNLASSVGGFLSVVVLAFSAIFVKRFPSSHVARIYEARTLIGKREPEPEAIEAPMADLPSTAMASPLTPSGSSTAERGYPARPPGIWHAGMQPPSNTE